MKTERHLWLDRDVPEAALISILGVATTSMILVRMATLWRAVAVGFFALGLLKLCHPRLLAVETDADRPAPAGA